jgi:hypothetical protein
MQKYYAGARHFTGNTEEATLVNQVANATLVDLLHSLCEGIAVRIRQRGVVVVGPGRRALVAVDVTIRGPLRRLLTADCMSSAASRVLPGA